jgi:hypothetical protein
MHANVQTFKVQTTVELSWLAVVGKGVLTEFSRKTLSYLSLFFFRLEMLWVELHIVAPSAQARFTHSEEIFNAGTLILSRSLSSLRVKLYCLYPEL